MAPSVNLRHTDVSTCHLCTTLLAWSFSSARPIAALPRPLFLSSSESLLHCAPHSSTARCMSACRTEPAANPGGPQGGAQAGRSPGGGAGRKLSPQLRNHLLRSGHHGGEHPTGWATHTTRSPERSGSETKHILHNTRQQTYLYPGLPYTESTGQST